MEEFTKRIDALPEMHGCLVNYPLISVETASRLKDFSTKGGIYVFYENNEPVYVGRTRNLKNRIRIHITSDEMGSNFALKIAKEVAGDSGLDISGVKNKKQLMQVPGFRDLFIAAKSRIRKMDLKIYEVEDPITQYLLEVYAHLSLGTYRYNNFNTY